MPRSQASKTPQSYVYAIGDTEQRHVKIGYSTNMPDRLASIQVGCHFEVRVLWTREGGTGLEGALHRHFADYRRRGEWFEFPAGQDAVELISRAADEIMRRPTAAAKPALEEPPALSAHDRTCAAIRQMFRDRGSRVVRVYPGGGAWIIDD